MTFRYICACSILHHMLKEHVVISECDYTQQRMSNYSVTGDQLDLCIYVWENCSSHHIRRTSISIFLLFLWGISFLFCFNMLNIKPYTFIFYFSFVNYFALCFLFNLLIIYLIHLLTCSLLRNCIAGLLLNGVTSLGWI